MRANGLIFDWIAAIGAKHVLEFGSSWATRFSTLQGIVNRAIQRGGNSKHQGSDQTLTAIRHIYAWIVNKRHESVADCEVRRISVPLMHDGRLPSNRLLQTG